MAKLKLTFLGSGNAFAPGGLCWNGFVVQDRFLFEAPPQALQSLNRLAIDPNTIEAVILSHHHADHFLGLAFLLLHWKYMGRKSPVRIVGPPGTEALGRDIFGRVYPGLFDISYRLDWLDREPGAALEIDVLKLRPVAVCHDERLSLSLGYACEIDGRRFAYTGDTAMCEAVLEMARESEILVCECASRADRIPIHMNLVDDIPKVRAAMAKRARLILTHLGPGVDATGLPNTVVAKDLKTLRC